MSSLIRFQAALARCPLIAILRGVPPGDSVDIGAALVTEGFGLIEVPLNSPEPLDSLERLAHALGPHALIGAGTVIDAKAVPLIRATGAKLIISPNVDEAVISATLAGGLTSVPGYFTPSEAFQAVRAGAHALKYFPAKAGHPDAVRALRAVLPRPLPLIIVGGITPADIPVWQRAGANGFGIGTQLYRPGDTAKQVQARARAFVQAARNG